MSTPLAEAFVSVRADTSNVKGDVKRGFDASGADKAGRDAGERAGKSMSAGMLGSFKGIAGGLAGVLAAAGIGNIVSDVFGEAREAQRVGKLTANALKVTGGAAKISQKQIEDLSQAISNKTGIDDEAVQSGANLLLTFKNVRNEVGKGNDVFSQATGYAQDLAAAGFGDAEGAAKMLGKALNDPLKGMTALGRAGVTFSADQQKQIKTLVKSGHLLDAQKIILGEVGAQVGGAAQAAADPMQKLGVVIANLEEDLGTAFLPMIENVATWLGDNLPGAMQNATDFVTNTLIPSFKKVSDFIGPIADAISGVFDLFGSNEDGAADKLSSALGIDDGTLYAVKDGFTTVRDTFLQAFGAIRDFIVTEVVPRVELIVDRIRRFIDVALPIVEQFVSGMRAKIEPLMPQIQHIFSTIGDIIKGALDIIAGVIGLATQAISFIWTNWGDGIMNVVSAAWTAIIGIIGPALDIIKSVIQTVMAAIHGDWSGVWDGIKGIIDGTFRLIIGIVTGALGILKELLSGAWSAIKGFTSTAWDQFTGIISGAWDSITTKVSGAVEGMKTNVANAFSSLAGLIRGPINNVIDLINGLIDKINAILPDALDIPHVPGLDNASASVASGARHAAGGPIRGPGTGTSDSVPIRASAGEWVIREAAARALGTNMMSLINSADRNGLADISGDPGALGLKFADGGQIPAIQDFIRSTDPLPYVWGGVGPGGYDCSGLTGAVYGKLLGQQGVGRRYFVTTSNFPGLGFKPGTGTYTIGVSATHMAGNLAGLAFEAASTKSGIHVGGSAKDVMSFPAQYYLPQIGDQFVGGGGGGGGPSLGVLLKAAFDLASGPLMSAIGGVSGPLGPLGKVLQGIGSSVRDGIGAKISTFDNGGTLSPGYNMVYNGTGGPESLRRVDEPMRWHRDDLDYIIAGIGGAAGAAVLTGRNATAQTALMTRRR